MLLICTFITFIMHWLTWKWQACFWFWSQQLYTYHCDESVEYRVCFFTNFAGVGLVLNGVTHANNSIVTITDIGTDGAALLCTTTYSPCCDSANPETQWYFPNGSEVLNSDQSGIPIGDLPFYRTRNTPAYVLGSPDPIPSVELNRHPEGTTTGVFRCTVPDAGTAHRLSKELVSL